MNATTAIAAINSKLNHFQPLLAIILGSGLGEFVNELNDPQIFPYSELPGFPKPKAQVVGHAGQLIFGYFNDIPLMCFAGRAHVYEGTTADVFKTMIRTIKLLGCNNLLITNAAGGINENYKPGDIVMIHDHINFMSFNPLIGQNDDEFGERFFPIDDAYDLKLQNLLNKAAKKIDYSLQKGIYIGVTGPNFETPAEIRAFRRWGADLVGMSTIPEVLVAKHCGMDVAGLSVVTDMAAGMTVAPITHEQNIKTAIQASGTLIKLIKNFIQELADEQK